MKDKGGKKGGPRKGQRKQTGVVVAFPRKANRPPPPKEADDDFVWFRFRFRNGFVGAVPVMNKDIDRVWRLVQEPDGFGTFAVFDTPALRIALNLRHLACAQFDGHPESGLQGAVIPPTKTVDVMFADSQDFLHIDVEPDELTLADIDEKGAGNDLDDDEAEELIQLSNLFYYCDSSHRGSDYAERLQDEFGSSIWLRLNDVAMVCAPLEYIKESD